MNARIKPALRHEPWKPLAKFGRVRARPREALLSAECLLGEAISEQIRRHHRRRLRRLGWENALDAAGNGWAVGDPPRRAGNAVDVLIDGAESTSTPSAQGGGHSKIRRARSGATFVA